MFSMSRNAKKNVLIRIFILSSTISISVAIIGNTENTEGLLKSSYSAIPIEEKSISTSTSSFNQNTETRSSVFDFHNEYYNITNSEVVENNPQNIVASSNQTTNQTETTVPSPPLTTASIDPIQSTSKSPYSNINTKGNVTNMRMEESFICDAPNELDIYRNTDNCSKFFISCILPPPLVASLTTSPETPMLKEIFKIEKSCSEGTLFDDIEKRCLPSWIVNCKLKYEDVCDSTTKLHTDPMQRSVFIECFYKNKSATRQKCQPRGTLFDETLQICIKSTILDYKYEQNSTIKSEPRSFLFLRFIVWIVSNTQDILSPWMEKIKLHRNGSKDSTPFNPVNSDPSKSNASEIILKHDFDEEDEVSVLTENPWYLALYYGVLVGIPIIIIFVYFLVACICTCLCRSCDKEEEDDNLEDFYGYNQNDKYIMTRL